MGGSRKERLIENQEMFRYAKEKLRDRVVESGITDHRHIPFLCECGEEACQGRIEVTLDEYEQAHFLRNQYFALPGHLRVAGEESMEDNGRYDVLTTALE